MNNGEIERQRDQERRREAWRRVVASRVPCEMHTVEDTARERKRERHGKSDNETEREREEERDAFVASE
jgi:hypothetical protein